MVNSRTVSAIVTAKVNKQGTDLCSSFIRVSKNPCPLHCMQHLKGIFNPLVILEGQSKRTYNKINVLHFCSIMYFIYILYL